MARHPRADLNRRDVTLGLMAAGLLPALSQAQGPRRPEEGADFRGVSPRAPVEAPAGRIEVVEFFWYGCPHCHAFEPQLDAWSRQLPADVALRRVPVAFREDFVPQQKLFYALEALGRLDLHARVFHTVHVERQPTHRDDTILAWAVRQGLDRARFQEAYNSFGVATRARRALQLQEAYQVEGVPALGVAGRFYTDGQAAGSMPRALQVVDYLVAEVRRGR